MSLPIRHLPVLQQWDCQGCGRCCYEYAIGVTPEERARILAQGWENDPAFAKTPLFVRFGRWWARKYRLNHRENGACVFLSPEGRCRIHERFGSDAKPLACRLYPFALIPTADHWRVGLRFACPSAAANLGRPMIHHQPELIKYVEEMESVTGVKSGVMPAPRLQPGQRLDWQDLFQVTRSLLAILRNEHLRFEARMRQCLALVNVCRQARFDKLAGNRIAEFFRVVTAGIEAEVALDPAVVPAPTWIGRVLFRQMLSLYVRKDHGLDRGLAVKGRLALLRAAWRFALGKGLVPPLNARIPPMTFEDLEKPRGPLPQIVEQTLMRYYSVKVESMQFCGPTNFNMPFWEGLESLVLTFPAILWLSKALSGSGADVAVAQAISFVDNHFGYNPILGTMRYRLSLRILARRGELERLIAWYSR